MNIAYLSVVHKNPRLLRRAIGTLSFGNCAFFVHVDKKANIQEFSSIQGDNIFFSKPRMPVYWAEFSNVEATTQLIRQALGSSVIYDYFVFTQGSDYPLRSGKYIQRFMEQNSGSEFISMVKMPAPGYPLSKINTVRFTSDKPICRFTSRALAKFGLAQRDYRKSLGELDAYAGDACWALSRDACQYLLDFAGRNPHVERYFRHTHAPDESFYHTILGNASFRVRPSLLYRDWSIPGHHPAMLTDAHVSFFEEQEQVWVQDQFGSGEALFARKFSDNNLVLLDRIDAMIERKERSEIPATILAKAQIP